MAKTLINLISHESLRFVAIVLSNIFTLLPWVFILQNIRREPKHTYIQRLLFVNLAFTFCVGILFGILTGFVSFGSIMENPNMPPDVLAYKLSLPEPVGFLIILAIAAIKIYLMYAFFKARGWYRNYLNKIIASVMALVFCLSPDMIVGYLIGDVIKNNVEVRSTDSSFIVIKRNFYLVAAIHLIVAVVLGIIAGIASTQSVITIKYYSLVKKNPIPNEVLLLIGVMLKLLSVYFMYVILKARGWFTSNVNRIFLVIILISSYIVPSIIFGYFVGDILKEKLVDNQR